MGRLFGTDGIRGVANRDPMTPETACAVGRALVEFLRGVDGSRPLIVVGRDTRLSGPMLESALTAGICSVGGDVIRVGVLPTPGVAFTVRAADAQAGVVISASHNPFQDNGIKVFSALGLKLSEDDERRIEDLVAGSADIAPALGQEIGTAEDYEQAEDRYAAFCRSAFPGDDLTDVNIVLDCANGATFRLAPEVFSGLGARISVMNDRPDGSNINRECGSEHTEGLSVRVRELGADVGLAFDGDGDRLIAVDERGERLTGDQVIALCARMYKDRGWLDNDTVVTTIMSNLGLTRALAGMGVKHLAAQVGDRHVVEMMLESGAVVGGEESGHIIFKRHHSTGDGILAGLQLLAAMKSSGRPLSELAGVMRVMPQVTVNVDVASKPPLEQIPRLSDAIAQAQRLLGDDGRVLVRYSGTQAMCRVMVEGSDADAIQRVASMLVSVVGEEIGAGQA